MATIIITDIVGTDDFAELEINHQLFWDIFALFRPLFEKELTSDAFNRFVGVSQALDTQDLTDIPKAVFQKAVAILKSKRTFAFNELIQQMQADPRYTA